MEDSHSHFLSFGRKEMSWWDCKSYCRQILIGNFKTRKGMLVPRKKVAMESVIKLKDDRRILQWSSNLLRGGNLLFLELTDIKKFL